MRWEDDEKEERERLTAAQSSRCFGRCPRWLKRCWEEEKTAVFFPSVHSESFLHVVQRMNAAFYFVVVVVVVVSAVPLLTRTRSWRQDSLMREKGNRLSSSACPTPSSSCSLFGGAQPNSVKNSSGKAVRQCATTTLLHCSCTVSTVSLKLLLLLLLYNIYCTAAVLYNVATLKRPPCPSSPSPPPPPLSLSLSSIQKQI